MEEVEEERLPGGTAGLSPPEELLMTDGALMSRSHKSRSTSPMSDDGSEW